MKELKKTSSKTFYIFLFLCVIAFFWVHCSTLYDGHNWGGDFSHYIRHAKNLLEGKEYTNGILIHPWATPPGYPLIILPFIEVFGLNFKVLKIPNVIFWFLFVVFFHPLARRRLGEEIATVISVVFLTSPFFFIFKQNVISDIPFLFFTTISLWFFVKHEEEKDVPSGQWYYLGFLVSALCATCTRWAGLSLYAASFFYFLVKRRGIKWILPLFLSLAAALAVLYGFGSVLGSHLEKYPHPVGESLARSFDYIEYAFLALVGFFFYLDTRISTTIFFAMQGILPWGGPGVFLVMAMVFLNKVYRRSISFLGSFFFIYFLMILGWAEAQGPRYVLPIAGLALIYSIEGFFLGFQKLPYFLGFLRKSHAQNLVKGVLLFLILNNVMSITFFYHFNDDAVNQKPVQELAEWVKHNLQPDDYFMFQNPRVLALLTDRVGIMTLWSYKDKTIWYRRIPEYNIRYVVLDKAQADALMSFVDTTIVSLQQAWENETYQIFEVLNN